MIDKIRKAYEKFTDEYCDMFSTHHAPEMVIRVSRACGAELMSETLYLDRYGTLYFNLYDKRIPIIFDDTIPVDVNFIFQLKKDYINQEHMKLDEKFSIMFGEKNESR